MFSNVKTKLQGHIVVPVTFHKFDFLVLSSFQWKILNDVGKKRNGLNYHGNDTEIKRGENLGKSGWVESRPGDWRGYLNL